MSATVSLFKVRIDKRTLPAYIIGNQKHSSIRQFVCRKECRMVHIFFTNIRALGVEHFRIPNAYSTWTSYEAVMIRVF